MEILSHFNELMTLDVLAPLADAPDPEVVAEQQIEYITDRLAVMKAAATTMSAKETRCQHLLNANLEDIAKYKHLAERALLAGNENDARAFLTKRQECQYDSVVCQNAYDKAHSDVLRLTKMVEKLNSDLDKLRMRLNEFRDNNGFVGSLLPESAAEVRGEDIVGDKPENMSVKLPETLTIDEELAVLKAELSMV